MRLRALGIVDDEGAQILHKRRNARWGAKSEPSDNDRAPEQPRLLRRTIDLLIESNIMPLDAIPRHIGLSANDIESLTGLPREYFQGRNKVINLSSLRQQKASADVGIVSKESTVLNFPISHKS
jgi:hypothetical protein